MCEEQQECMYVCHTSSNKQIACNNDNDSVYRDVQVDSLKTVVELLRSYQCWIHTATSVSYMPGRVEVNTDMCVMGAFGLTSNFHLYFHLTHMNIF